MRQMFRNFFFITIVSLLFFGCSSGRNEYTIGVDPNWYPLNFGAQNSYVNGFTDEVLLDISTGSSIDFLKIEANWDSLLDGLKNGTYDGVLTSLPPYEFNQALYDFSQNFLNIGPVLIVPEDSPHTTLKTMANELIGIITGDPAVLLLQKQGDLIVRNYPTIPDLLEAVANADIEGALLNLVPAGNYVADLYSKKLKIVGQPLDNTGLHLVVLKGKQSHLLYQFNSALSTLEQKKRLSARLKKWQLGE